MSMASSLENSSLPVLTGSFGNLRKRPVAIEGLSSEFVALGVGLRVESLGLRAHRDLGFGFCGVGLRV